MISYDEALKIIQAVKPSPAVERLPLTACVGRILAEDVTAKIPSPPFTNSAMDGYAVCRADVAAGGAFAVLGTILARPVRADDLPRQAPRGVARIMTGAVVPEWADTVVPVEQSVLGADGQVRFTELAEQGANLRRRGDDMAAGSLVLKRGIVLEPERIMVAAAFGYRELQVLERPRLVIYSTGDELTEPGEPLADGAIYNSSKYFLIAAAKAAGFADPPHRTLADDEGAAADTVGQLLASGKPTVLITTGAVSAGDADFIPRLAAKLGFTALFHKVAIRPGKPVYLAVKDQVIWLGLPGNPISTCVGWHVFARPLLSVVAGIPLPEKRTLILKNEVRKPENLRCFFRAEVNGNRAWVAQRQGSAQFAASVTNEAYVELPEGFSRIPAETRVEAIIV